MHEQPPRNIIAVRLSTSVRSSAVPEFTLKAVIAGVILGIVFGAANAYLASGSG